MFSEVRRSAPCHPPLTKLTPLCTQHGMCSAYQLKPEPATGGYVWIPSALANSNIKLPRFEFELNKIPGVTRRVGTGDVLTELGDHDSRGADSSAPAPSPLLSLSLPRSSRRREGRIPARAL